MSLQNKTKQTNKKKHIKFQKITYTVYTFIYKNN